MHEITYSRLIVLPLEQYAIWPCCELPFVSATWSGAPWRTLGIWLLWQSDHVPRGSYIRHIDQHMLSDGLNRSEKHDLEIVLEPKGHFQDLSELQAIRGHRMSLKDGALLTTAALPSRLLWRMMAEGQCSKLGFTRMYCSCSNPGGS